MKIFDLVNEHRAVMDLIANDEIPEDCWLDTIESIELAIEDKARAYTAVILELEAEAKAKEDAAKKIIASYKTLYRKADFLRERLKISMIETGVTKFKFSEFSVSIPKPRASLEITNQELIPEKYKSIKQVIESDNAAIKNDLLSGVEVPGAKIEYKKSLLIRG